MATTFKSTTLRPGFLVSLKTSVAGNVKYEKTVIEQPKAIDGGGTQAKWETIKTVIDAQEDAAGRKARSQACSKIRGVCRLTSFGLLCPEIDRPALDAAVMEARKIVDEFNRTAKRGTVSLYIITGRVAPDDMEAVRAMNSEVVELLDEMTAGAQNADVEMIRKAAKRAREISGMLAPDAEAKLKIAIDAARADANRIARAGDDAGAISVDQSTINRLAEQRAAFVDVGAGDATVKAPKQAARTLDVPEELLPSGAEAPKPRIRADLD